MQRYKPLFDMMARHVGFQVQENGNSIQAELNKAFEEDDKGSIHSC